MFPLPSCPHLRVPHHVWYWYKAESTRSLTGQLATRLQAHINEPGTSCNNREQVNHLKRETKQKQFRPDNSEEQKQKRNCVSLCSLWNRKDKIFSCHKSQCDVSLPSSVGTERKSSACELSKVVKFSDALCKIDEQPNTSTFVNLFGENKSFCSTRTFQIEPVFVCTSAQTFWLRQQIIWQVQDSQNQCRLSSNVKRWPTTAELPNGGVCNLFENVWGERVLCRSMKTTTIPTDFPFPIFPVFFFFFLKIFCLSNVTNKKETYCDSANPTFRMERLTFANAK